MLEVVPRERPVLFSGPMVRALLVGKKTVTRRVAKPPVPGAVVNDVSPRTVQWMFTRDGKEWLRRAWCPYGEVGDRLWVRETWTSAVAGQPARGFTYQADHPAPITRSWRPSIHMPRAASRVLLEVTAVRVERVQDITEEQALAEGSCIRHDKYPDCLPVAFAGVEPTPPWPKGPRWCFAAAWEELNGKRGYGWEANPWVWVVEFKVVQS